MKVPVEEAEVGEEAPAAEPQERARRSRLLRSGGLRRPRGRARRAVAAPSASSSAASTATSRRSCSTGALGELEDAGVAREAITIMPVPGAFELPLAAMALAKTRRYACIVALGCVIRGDTPHFDFVAGEAASRAPARGARDRRPGLVRRPHARDRRAGRRADREGRRGRPHRPRDGRRLRAAARRASR